MIETVIVMDSCTDLPLKYVEDNNIPVLSLTCLLKGKEHPDDFGKSISYKEFYEVVRSGEMPSTSQVNTYRFIEEFKKHVQKGKSVIYIGFSSALSGTVNSAQAAKKAVKEEFENADITVIDSKSASLGYGLLVYYAYEMLKKGSQKEEIVSWVENNKLKMNHWFTVEDLFHLKRGGRVSGATAVIGTLLNIKPVLHVDDEGRLASVTKAKGRKKSLRMLAEELKKRIVNPEEQVIAISHGDCISDVEYLKEMIRNDVKVKDIIVNYVGPVIGTHSGPGTVALFFLGNER